MRFVQLHEDNWEIASYEKYRNPVYKTEIKVEALLETKVGKAIYSFRFLCNLLEVENQFLTWTYKTNFISYINNIKLF